MNLLSAIKPPSSGPFERAQIRVRGVVQGIGFRPFIYRIACELNLHGFIRNAPSGVTIEIEGVREDIEIFLTRIVKEKPVHSYFQSIETVYLAPSGHRTFKIMESDLSGERTGLVMPDIAPCPECLSEIFNPQNRRYLYPFTNCTHCGPRYSIINAIPYDRKNTSMKEFMMCEECSKEYYDDKDRRFHAQPNACPDCGPQLEFWDDKGNILSQMQNSIAHAAEMIRQGKIVAIKGLGGFQLLTDARNADAIHQLRLRKSREEKPFALMFPTIESVKDTCHISRLEEEILCGPQRPIVILKKGDHNPFGITDSVAPGNPNLGAMLPFTPLHHLLMSELNFPIIATSGNISDEPICIDEREALKRLSGIADYFLVHNRPIVRHVDDSIVRIIAHRPMVLRRARGWAPLPFETLEENPVFLGVGGQLKNTVALSIGKNIFVSQHIGDLGSKQSIDAFHSTIDSMQKLFDAKIEGVVCDSHPDYFSTQDAKKFDRPLIEVQHHHAHIAACMADNHIEGTVLGVSWDGTGYGMDQTIWGGEFLKCKLSDFDRIGHLKTFCLPGGEIAVKEPRRAALGVLFAAFQEQAFEMTQSETLKAFSASELQVLSKMIKDGIHSPLTSSAGRLFDAVASIIGLCQKTTFEGQAAMALEFLIGDVQTEEFYPVPIEGDPHVKCVDWTPIIKGILRDLKEGIPTGMISAKFHNSLIEIIVGMAQRTQEKNVVLSGGCFQNKYLSERTIDRLKQEGFLPHWHQRISPNDGGIALGQVVIACNRSRDIK